MLVLLRVPRSGGCVKLQALAARLGVTRCHAVRSSAHSKFIHQIQKWSMCVSIILQLRYYHSRTGAPIHPEHLECDSDDDADHEWLVQQVGRAAKAGGCVRGARARYV